MNRRDFMKLLGAGAATTAAGLLVPQLEPIRRVWQVPRHAPVGARLAGLSMSINRAPAEFFATPTQPDAQSHFAAWAEQMAKRDPHYEVLLDARVHGRLEGVSFGLAPGKVSTITWEASIDGETFHVLTDGMNQPIGGDNIDDVLRRIHG